MKIVIAGAGFGGLKLARKLNNKKGFEIVLIDRFNHHQFQPLFYQVATAGLDASNISFPLRKVFQKSRNVKIRMAEVLQVIPDENRIITSTEELTYDALVLALGADTNFFNNEQLSGHAIPMKSTVEALQLRNRILRNFEEALTIQDENALQQRMNIVVVGGGPTGVELSGAIAEMKRYVLPKDYPELDFSKMKIYLLEGSGKTLASMSERSSAQSAGYLEKMSVELLTDALVQGYDGKTVRLADGRTIESSLVIWAAGIKGNIPAGIDKSLIARGNRIIVDRYCKIQGTGNIYVIGDLAHMQEGAFTNGHPQVAPVAIQQAKLLVTNFKLAQKEKELKQFSYKDKGSMATVGRNKAVVDVPKPKLHFKGFFAWLIWMGLHLMLILGVKNRFFVFLNWLYSYITYDQNLRLIFKKSEGKTE
ncbi:MAG TPA: NAD(P)/FAD-dependent oxidoreductase [Chitinophagaceae bacterium]|nr:NAD(P)/FAD-dependent oxidoreductase [Chitinophagaceae bacterium]